jgi:hypothetical protein
MFCEFPGRFGAKLAEFVAWRDDSDQLLLNDARFVRFQNHTEETVTNRHRHN